MNNELIAALGRPPRPVRPSDALERPVRGVIGAGVSGLTAAYLLPARPST